FFDEFLLKTSHDAGVKQVVLLAAGMDTRAFRLPWPVKTRLYEIDSVEVLARKQSVLDRMGLKPACERHVVCADLTESLRGALLSTTYDSTQPSVWLIEGLFVYLTGTSVSTLMSKIG